MPEKGEIAVTITSTPGLVVLEVGHESKPCRAVRVHDGQIDRVLLREDEVVGSLH